MKFTEQLLWILDKNGKKINKEDEYKQNIDFVHSLGLKCDCVGWSKLDLSSPRSDEILSAIEGFCKENGWSARGYYTREYVDYDSDWYEIVANYFGYNTYKGLTSIDGSETKTSAIKAYCEMKSEPKQWGEDIFVPERFRDAYIQSGDSELDFCWVRDVGKYDAEQYFYIYGKKQISHICTDTEIKIDDTDRIGELGGYLPKLSGIFKKLKIQLQDCYVESSIPDSKIANAYVHRDFSHIGRNNFLIHKSLAEVLVAEKAISRSSLRPAMVVKCAPLGYTVEKTESFDVPPAEYMEASIKEYEKLKSSCRPSRKVSEKEALKLLRGAKRERKEDFKKALPKADAERVMKSAYSALLPYYLVSNGAYISDEYEVLPFDESAVENLLFYEEISKEELMDEKPSGVVFAKAADGDRILLSVDGNVLRFSHETMTVTETWQSLAEFMAFALND